MTLLIGSVLLVIVTDWADPDFEILCCGEQTVMNVFLAVSHE